MTITATNDALAGVALKFDRALWHLADFDHRAEQITFACQQAIQADMPSVEKDWRFSFNDKLPEVPTVLSSIIGDAVHNVRAGLDYLAYRIVVGQNLVPDDRTQFPIRNAPRTTLPDITPGLSHELRALLDEVQPYHRAPYAHNHSLEVLHRLDIADKHHDSLVSVVGCNSAGWAGDLELFAMNPGPYKPGDVLAWVRTPYDDVPKPGFMFEVRFDEPASGALGTVMGAADLVRDCLRYIQTEVIPRFEPYL